MPDLNHSIAVHTKVMNTWWTKKEYILARKAFIRRIASNLLLLGWAVTIQAWFPAAMYLLFVGTAGYGFVNHKEKV
jgi:hypothetical protein